MKKILPFFSYVLHPLFIPLFGTLIYMFAHENYLEPFTKWLIIVQILLITIMVPLTMLYFLKIIGSIDSIMVSNLAQRKVPLMIQLLLTGLLLVKSITTEQLPELFFYFLGGMLSTFIALVFLYFNKKISIHMIGVSSLTVFVIGLSIHDYTNWIFEIAALILLNGFVGSSRLQMKAHTGTELLLGFITGFGSQLALWWFWL